MTQKQLGVGACVGAALLLGGCFSASQQEVISKLSDKNLALEQDVAKLKGHLADKDATIEQQRQALDQQQPRVPTLTKDRLADLITVGRVQLRRGTTTWDADNDGTLDSFRVFVRPVSSDGFTIPATGTLTVSAFDLANEKSPLLGKWTFQPADLKQHWYSGFGLDQFAVNCKWETPPAHAEILFKIEFLDALTGSTFVDQQTFKVRLPAATQPSTSPATQAH